LNTVSHGIIWCYPASFSINESIVLKYDIYSKKSLDVLEGLEMSKSKFLLVFVNLNIVYEVLNLANIRTKFENKWRTPASEFGSQHADIVTGAVSSSCT
jgi:hypothetical protein